MKRYIKSSSAMLKSGDFVKIGEWGKVQIDDVFDNEEEALADGYDRPTSYYKNGYKINTREIRDIGRYNSIEFGAYKIDVSKDITNDDAEYTIHNAKFTIHDMMFTCSDLESGISKSWKIDYSPNCEYIFDFKKTKLNTNCSDMQKLLNDIVTVAQYFPRSLAEQAGFEIDNSY